MAKKTFAKKAVPKKIAVKKTSMKKAPAKKAMTKNPAAMKTAPKKVSMRKLTVKKAKSACKPNSAFMKALTPSAVLANVIGAIAVPRTEMVKKLWAYIKNPKNKRNILADEKLEKVFGKKEVTMFELGGIVGKHFK